MTPPPARLPSRPKDGHKGTFGPVTVIGGSASGNTPMLGAPVLASIAAMRAGAGGVRLAMPDLLLPHGLARNMSAIGFSLATHDGILNTQACVQTFDQSLDGARSLVLGPGWGKDAAGEDAREVITLRAIAQDLVPVVLDADGLGCYASLNDPLPDTRAPMVITPHPGEYRRLAQALRITADPLQTPEDAAAQMASLIGCVVVLKSARTVVSDGMQHWTCESGHPCLATAGSGDVLAGIIAGLIAQHVRLEVFEQPGLSLFEAACLGVEIHARAAQLWAIKQAASAGMLASDLLDLIPRAAESLR